MSGFEVDPSELFAAGARVSEGAADGHGSLTRVRLDAEDLFAGGWTGAAGAAFERGFEDWLGGARQMLAGLEDLASALTAAGHDYECSERTNAGSLRHLPITGMAS